jgi:cardiolipin synthase
LLLAQGDSTAARWALPIGWAFAWWGIVLYWIAAVLYAGQAVGLLRQDRRHHRGRALA